MLTSEFERLLLNRHEAVVEKGGVAEEAPASIDRGFFLGALTLAGGLVNAFRTGLCGGMG